MTLCPAIHPLKDYILCQRSNGHDGEHRAYIDGKMWIWTTTEKLKPDCPRPKDKG
jgi:hypothetical protein